jgi:hypothetical protein
VHQATGEISAKAHTANLLALTDRGRKISVSFNLTEAKNGAVAEGLARFDLQQMENPEISGAGHQQGKLAGYEIRGYLPYLRLLRSQRDAATARADPSQNQRGE